MPLGLPRHDDVLAGLWIALHARCCTAPSFSLLRNDSRFAGEIGSATMLLPSMIPSCRG